LGTLIGVMPMNLLSSSGSDTLLLVSPDTMVVTAYQVQEYLLSKLILVGLNLNDTFTITSHTYTECNSLKR
jgi:hypothetical protein